MLRLRRGSRVADPCDTADPDVQGPRGARVDGAVRPVRRRSTAADREIAPADAACADFAGELTDRERAAYLRGVQDGMRKARPAEPMTRAEAVAAFVRQVDKAGSSGISSREIAGLSAAQIRTAREAAIAQHLVEPTDGTARGCAVRYVAVKKSK